MNVSCAICGAASPDGYVDRQCGLKLAQRLSQAAGHAEDADTVVARQTRYGTGGSSSDDLPVDFTASDRLADINNTITGWVRVITEHTGRAPRWRPMVGPTCAIGVRCDHLSCAAIRRRLAGPPVALMTAWLAQHADTLRKHPAAAEAFDQLHHACGDLERLVDRPADKDLVGVCDCGRILYAPRDRRVIQCPVTTCRLVWDVAASRDTLRRHLGDKLVTLPEAARLAAYLDSDRTQDTIRKLLTARLARLAAHGSVWRDPTDTEIAAAEQAGEEAGPVAVPTYRFGDAVALLAEIPKRRRAVAVAETERMSA